jgi:glycoprotein endo-alpha-1,2-mannosidase
LSATPVQHGVGVAAFYYPWYATIAQDGQVRHWDQGGHTPPDDVGSDYYPSRGAYSSTDPAVLDAQMAEIADAGINEIVSSWWGQGSFEDHALTGVLSAAAAHGVRVGIHLEPYIGRTTDTVASDVNYLRGRGITDIWIYEALMLPADGLRAVNDAHRGDLHLAETGNIVAVRSGAFARWAASAHFGAVYTYDAVRYEGGDFPALCASARAVGLGCAPGVAPGFSAARAGGGPFRTRANGATFDNRWMGAIGAHPDIIAITSYNEWHEGSQIEPAVPKCLSATFCYRNYDGAYGLFGDPAVDAYIGRTKAWTARYRAASP